MMKAYDIYVFLLCLIVYVLLTGFAVVVLSIITKQSLKLIKCGAEDVEITKEYAKAKQTKKHAGIDCIVSVVFGVLFILFFAFSIYVNVQQASTFDKIATLRVVNSASMSYKHEKNTYLTKNGLNDQFDTFDIILTYKLPAEKDLKLYDIVVYEVDDTLVIHRIVGIEEPTETHTERYFLLQGDAVDKPDRFPVRYEQMRAIYRGQRVPFIGSLVSFMQSPAGWICVLLIVIATIASPILDEKLAKEREKRFKEIVKAKTAQTIAPNVLPPIVLYPVPMAMPLYGVPTGNILNKPKNTSLGGRNEK